MAGHPELLKTTEAAVVAGVGLREVNRVFDEGILPKEFLRADEARYITPAACLFIAFYFESADQLTAKERRLVIRRAAPRLRHWTGSTRSGLSTENLTVRHKLVAVDLAPLVRAVGDRLGKLAEAEELVSSSPDVLGGTPVVKGTRIPVHDLAASLGAGISKERLLAAYPALDAGKIDLAAVYAKANPPRGRPSAAGTLPAGAVILVDRRKGRRRKTG